MPLIKSPNLQHFTYKTNITRVFVSKDECSWVLTLYSVSISMYTFDPYLDWWFGKSFYHFTPEKKSKVTAQEGGGKNILSNYPTVPNPNVSDGRNCSWSPKQKWNYIMFVNLHLKHRMVQLVCIFCSWIKKKQEFFR